MTGWKWMIVTNYVAIGNGFFGFDTVYILAGEIKG